MIRLPSTTPTPSSSDLASTGEGVAAGGDGITDLPAPGGGGGAEARLEGGGGAILGDFFSGTSLALSTTSETSEASALSSSCFLAFSASSFSRFSRSKSALVRTIGTFLSVAPLEASLSTADVSAEVSV